MQQIWSSSCLIPFQKDLPALIFNDSTKKSHFLCPSFTIFATCGEIIIGGHFEGQDQTYQGQSEGSRPKRSPIHDLQSCCLTRTITPALHPFVNQHLQFLISTLNQVMHSKWQGVGTREIQGTDIFHWMVGKRALVSSVQYFGLYKSLVIPDLEHACSSDNPAIARMFMHPTHHSLILGCSFLTTQASPSPSFFLCNHRMCSICPYTLALISIQGLEELFQARGGSHMFPTVFVAFSAPGVASFTNVRPSVG